MNSFFKPTDIAYLVFFRIVFGILCIAEGISLFSYLHLYKRAFDPELFHFKYYGFEWVHPMPDPFMSIFFVLLILAGVGIMLGWRYRWCMLFYAFGFSYTFYMEAGFYLNHGYLFMMLCFSMLFFPAHRAYSLDVLQERVTPIKGAPRWPLLFLRFMMAVVYIYGGIAKINADWLNAVPLKYWLAGKSKLFLIGPVVKLEQTAWFMSYGGLALDLLVVPFLLIKKTRPWAFGCVLFFHFVNLLIFEIGIFPWMSTALTALYFSPDFPKRLWNWLSSKIKKLQSVGQWWQQLWAPSLDRQIEFHYSSLQKKLITTSLIVFCSIQLLLPLRHHLYNSHVLWTEQGHRYSWRMMLRSKQGRGHFKVVDKATSRNVTVNIRKYVSKRQARKVYMHPYFILQVAHMLREEYKKEGMVDPEVYADLKLRVNGRPYQQYVNPNIDLAKEKWSIFRSVDWLEPYEDLNRNEN